MSDPVAGGDRLVALDNAAAEFAAALKHGAPLSPATLRLALETITAHAQWVRVVRESMPPLVVR